MSLTTVTSTVTSKGQITIPKEVRAALGIETGTKVVFVRTSWGYLLRAKNVDIMDLRGILKYDGPPLSDDEVDRRVGAAMAEKYRP